MSERDCQHGQQARACNVCELERELDEARSRIVALELDADLHAHELSPTMVQARNDQLAKELVETIRQLEAARDERNKIAMRVRNEWMAKAAQADKERDEKQAALVELIKAAKCMMNAIAMNETCIIRFEAALREAGVDDGFGVRAQKAAGMEGG